ncbi:glycosyltransferase family 2 protein [Chryseobacterium sp. Leaf394]|uniref:glycosyltransferase family 2 protein n=1 Tax=Chryseobacterium sp. Leaf394 TaxID=1736361 RepID=UPI0006F3CA46|nr:glycosyltransferase family 2 protein [Chryseobacterium sp. Leaf394]KQS93203.1 hypothetical protein ASG21_12495 [Chryseobacterium sp. Leaf394]
MQVSIIIVNYNTLHLVEECIKSIKKNTKIVSYEIIVVDNLSPNRDIETLTVSYPDVKLILNNRNAGFGSANNLGAKSATGQFLLFLNSDTILLNDAVSILEEYYKVLPDAGVVGGNLYSENLAPMISYDNFYPNIWTEMNGFFFDILAKIKYNNFFRFNNTLEVKKIEGFIGGADYFISKDLFQTVNGFDEDFFMYYEETELSKRIKDLGYKFYSIPQAKIIHLEGGSQDRLSNQKFLWMTQSKKKFFIKTKTPFFVLCQYILYLGILRSLLLSFCKKDKALVEKNKLFLQIIKENL